MKAAVVLAIHEYCLYEEMVKGAVWFGLWTTTQKSRPSASVFGTAVKDVWAR